MGKDINQAVELPENNNKKGNRTGEADNSS